MSRLLCARCQGLIISSHRKIGDQSYHHEYLSDVPTCYELEEQQRAARGEKAVTVRPSTSPYEQIVRELADSDPIGDAYPYRCYFCENAAERVPAGPGTTKLFFDDKHHKPDCLWIRARKAVGK